MIVAYMKTGLLDPPGYKEAYRNFISDGWTSLFTILNMAVKEYQKHKPFFEEILLSAIMVKLYSELSIGACCILHHAMRL